LGIKIKKGMKIFWNRNRRFYLESQLKEDLYSYTVDIQSMLDQLFELGYKQDQSVSFDFSFVSSQLDNTLGLVNALKQRMVYDIEYSNAAGNYDVVGNINISLALEEIKSVVIEMCNLGYEFDSRITGYGVLKD